jgi:hypothetical protein
MSVGSFEELEDEENHLLGKSAFGTDMIEVS